MKGRTQVLRALLLAMAVMPVAARAQSVRGTVSGAGATPVAGVTVILLDTASNAVASALSDARGAYLLRVTAPGNYRIRTLRVGFRSTVSPAFSLAAGEETTRRLDVEEIRFLLDTVHVTGRNACRLASDSASATYAVW